MPADASTTETTPQNPPPVGEMIKGGPDWRVPGNADAKVIEQQAGQKPPAESQPPTNLQGIDTTQAREKIDQDLNVIRQNLEEEGSKTPDTATPTTPTSPTATEQKTGLSASLKQKLGSFMNRGNKPH